MFNMKIEHEVKKVGNLQKIEVRLKDDKGKPVDDELSIIINSPDGLETIYLPADTLKNDDENSIYMKSANVPATLVSRIKKGVYKVVYAPDAKGEHECVVVLMGNDKIDDHRFKFKV